MPLYEFQCKNCGSIKEQFYKIAERPNKAVLNCEMCGGNKEFEFLVSSPAVVYGVLSAAKKMPSAFKNRMDEIRKTHNPNMTGKYY